MDYGDETMSHAVVTEGNFNKFFLNVKAVLRGEHKDDVAKWGEEETKLGNAIDECKESTHEALCDDFDTPKVMASLQVRERERERRKGTKINHRCSILTRHYYTHFTGTRKCDEPLLAS